MQAPKLTSENGTQLKSDSLSIESKNNYKNKLKQIERQKSINKETYKAFSRA